LPDAGRRQTVTAAVRHRGREPGVVRCCYLLSGPLAGINPLILALTAMMRHFCLLTTDTACHIDLYS
jgi:hypothetical protein